MLAWNIKEKSPYKFTIAGTTYTVSDNNNNTWTVNDGTSDVHTTSSASVTTGYIPTASEKLATLLEILVFGILKESAQADTYTTDLWDDDTLIGELAANLKAVFDSMEFETSVE